PRDPDPLGFQSSVYYWQRRWAEGEKALVRMIALTPADVEAQLSLARVRAHLHNDWNIALREYQRLDPEMNPQQKPDTVDMRRDYRGALEVLRSNPNDFFGVNHRSILIAENEAKLGHREAALAAYREGEAALRKILAERPRDDFARINLSYVCIMLGK